MRNLYDKCHYNDFCKDRKYQLRFLEKWEFFILSLTSDVWVKILP